MIISVFFDNLGNFIINHSSEFVSSFIILISGIFAILVGYFVQKNYTEKKDRKKNLIYLAKNIFTFYRGLVIFIIVLLIANSWGVNLTAVLVGIAIVLIAVVFSARKIIADIISGLFINFSDYYNIDDVVEINGFIGYVKEITLRSTKLVNSNNESRIISNSEISEFTNYSKLPYIYSIEIKTNYSVDINKIITLLEDSFINFEDNYDNIIEGPNVIGLKDITNQGYIIKIIVKTKYDFNNATITNIKRFIKETLDHNKIEFMFIEEGSNE